MLEENNDSQGIFRFPDLGKFADRGQDAEKSEKDRRNTSAEGAPVEQSFSMEEAEFYETRAQKAEVWAKWCRKKLENIRKGREKEEPELSRGTGTKMKKTLEKKLGERRKAEDES